MTPIFYSFRRCPYAMRARLALGASGVEVELREILLKDKPDAFLASSPSGTVPSLVTDQGVIDESFDIMLWALKQNDPAGWLSMPAEGMDWIERSDGPFKQALDRTKYGTRYADSNPIEQRAIASEFLSDLDQQISDWMFDRPTLADFAILPFVRQFAFIDKSWFDSQNWPDLQNWLERFLSSQAFTDMMEKYAPWKEGDPPLHFPSKPSIA